MENSQSACSTAKSMSCYSGTATTLGHRLEVSQAKSSYDRPANVSFEESPLYKQQEESGKFVSQYN